MLKLAANPGTIEEGRHASYIATRWIEKYQLEKAFMMNDSFHCAEYEIQVRLSTDAWRGADKVFQSSCNSWIRDLAIKVASIYTDFVKGFTKKVNLFDHTWFSIIFVGVEDAAWSATDLFCSLFRIICHYTFVMVKSGRYHAVKSIESYAVGLVNGLSIDKKKAAQPKESDLGRIRENGRALIEEWTASKHIRKPVEGQVKKLDVLAHQNGQMDGIFMNGVTQT